MRTSAPTQLLRPEPIFNSQSEIRNQQVPCSEAATDESAAKHLFKLSRDVILPWIASEKSFALTTAALN